MTDEEINKRVAEIEKWTYRQKEWGLLWSHHEHVLPDAGPPPYATDWAWCGPLVEKYDLDVYRMRGRKGKPWVCMRHDVEFLPEYHADTPQRAICLAVIAAHEGK